jgi:hypothetical protein
MPSVGTVYAQRPSKKFAVTQDQGAYFFSDADVSSWLSANSSKIEQIGSLILINGTTSGSTFRDVLTGTGGAVELEYNNSRLDERKTITDMGKELCIGTTAQPRLLVLRRVQRYLMSASAGSNNPNDLGYVVSENNADDLNQNWGRFTVRVARV